MKKISLLILVSLVFAVPVLADTTIPNPLGYNTLGDLLGRIANFLFYIMIAVAPLIIIWGAFTIVTSGGDPNKVSKGTKTILYTAIGLALVLVSKGIVSIIESVMGV